MGRPYRLIRRSSAGLTNLTGNSQILADAAGWRADAELFRHAHQDRAAASRHAGLRDPGPTPSRHWQPDQPVRHRIAGTNVIACDSRACRRTRKRIARQETRAQKTARTLRAGYFQSWL